MSAGKDIVRRATGFMKMGAGKPIWFDSVASRYPPLTFQAPKAIKPAAGRRPKNSPEPIWRPPKLVYPEDRFAARTLKEHPVEKLKPATLDEFCGDRSNVQTIVNYQLELIEQGKPAAEAYSLASGRFWEERKEAEIARKVAMEQAKYNKDQVRACTVRNPAPNRLRPVSDVIRDILLEEKANLVKNRINTESSQ